MKTYLLTYPVVDNDDSVTYTVGRSGAGGVERVQVDIDLRLLTEFLFAAIDGNTTGRTKLAYGSIVAKKIP